jgi:Domain of unknown function (DUF4350)
VSTDQLERSATASATVTSEALGPTLRARLTAMRRPSLVIGLVLLVVVAIGYGRASGSAGYLDPDSATPDGGRALRVLLEERGVAVTHVTSAPAALAVSGAGDTLLVITPTDASAADLDQLARSRADLVLVDPTPTVLAALAPWLQPADSVEVSPRDPVCNLRAAVQAGRASTGGLTFSEHATAGEVVSLCYAANGAATVAQATLADGRTVTVLGSGGTLTNDLLAQEGDAALGLDLLGAHPKLVWYVVANTLDETSGNKSLLDLLPPWIGPTVLQLFVGVLLLALWQGRRFGPVVAERLPVVVRAAEATEGRARLYRRAGARDRAAQNIRAATLVRLIPLVGQQRSATPTAVSEAVAARTGRPGPEVAALLYGSAPADDAALVRLANELDVLERMVRHP